MEIRPNYASIIFSALIIAIILISMFLAYDKYIVRRDFFVEAKIPCNPDTESCFKEDCDIEDPRCVNDGAFYFKIINKKAYVDLPFDQCQAHDQCEAIYCQDDTIANWSEYETCF